MDNGWIKIHRSIQYNEVFLFDDTAWKVFMLLLVKADRKTGTYRNGRIRMAEAFNMKQTTLYDALKRLEKHGMINRETAGSSTVYHICKFKNYQQDARQLPDNTPTIHRQLPDTKQEVIIKNKEKRVSKNIKKEDKKRTSSSSHANDKKKEIKSFLRERKLESSYA